jgi:hypothetical protein
MRSFEAMLTDMAATIDSMANDLQPLPETLELIYEHTRGGPSRQVATGDAIDAKAFQIFSAATVVLGLGTFATPHLGVLSGVFYGLAAAAYVLAGERAWRVVRARQYQVVDGADRGGRVTDSLNGSTFSNNSSTRLP